VKFRIRVAERCVGSTTTREIAHLLTHTEPLAGCEMNGPVALVVDDDLAQCAKLIRTLTGLGVRVFEATDYDSAATHLRRGPVQMLFVELQLPGRGAERLMALARSTAPHHALVLMTRRPALESAIEAIRMGACDYLPKPLDAETVHRACQRALAGRTGTSPPEAAKPAAAPGETPSADPQRRRGGSSQPAEMTVSVPLAGDFRKISQCLVREALARFDGNKAAAARALGMHRKTLYRLLQSAADSARDG
jgi:two-component system, response regulator RegA